MKTQLIIISAALFFARDLSNFSSVTNPGRELAKTEAKQLKGGFSFLKTHRQGKGVTATWAMTSTEAVTGFTIQKTYEDPNDTYSYWEEVNTVPCDFSRSFKYTDTNVFPGSVNYRVVAHFADGTSVSSEISTIKLMSRG